MSVVVGNALDDLVGAIVARKGDEGFMSAVDRQFLEMELNLIKQRIDGYKKGEHETEAAKAELNSKLQEELANQKDIFTYLNGELAKKTDEIVDLQGRLIALQDENDRQTTETETRLMAAKDAADLAQAHFQQELGALQAELDSLTTFKKHKVELEAELAVKTRQLEEDAKEHATAISDLERKHVQEKDRLKKEMLLKLRETKANLLKMTDNQLDTTTKRTIAENEQMASELAWQSKEAEKLIRRNDKLAGDNGALRRELELARGTEAEMAKKVNVYQKTLDTLMTKLSALEASKEQDQRSNKVQDDEAERRRTESLRHVEVLMAKLADADDRAAAAEMELRRMVAALNDVEARHAAVLALQDDAVRFALQCFDDVRQQRAVAPRGGSPPTGVDRAASPAEAMGGGAGERTLASINAEDREEVLGYLLEQLGAYQQQLQELALHSAWEQHHAQSHGASHGGSGGLGGSTHAPHLSLPPIAGGSDAHHRRPMKGQQLTDSITAIGGPGGGKVFGVRGVGGR